MVMSDDRAFETWALGQDDEVEGRIEPLGVGHVFLHSTRAPGKTTPNEDAVGVMRTGPTAGVIALADGVGGAPGGAQASALAVSCALESIRRAVSDGLEPRYGAIDGFETANREVLARVPSGATTLIVALVEERKARTLHVGDSFMVLIGQRGKIKRETLSHSPTGYGVAAGLMDEEEALHHGDRHVLSNFLGSREMNVEVSTRFVLAKRDTMILASDGLSDNLPYEEIAELARKGPLASAGSALVAAAVARMNGTDGSPGKAGRPDGGDVPHRLRPES